MKRNPHAKCGVQFSLKKLIKTRPKLCWIVMTTGDNMVLKLTSVKIIQYTLLTL